MVLSFSIQKFLEFIKKQKTPLTVSMLKTSTKPNGSFITTQQNLLNADQFKEIGISYINLFKDFECLRSLTT